MTTDAGIETIGFEGAPVALCVTRQRIMAACNPAFADLFGYRREELLGQSIAILYPSLQEFRRIGQRGYPNQQRNGQIHGTQPPNGGDVPYPVAQKVRGANHRAVTRADGVIHDDDWRRSYRFATCQSTYRYDVFVTPAEVRIS